MKNAIEILKQEKYNKDTKKDDPEDNYFSQKKALMAMEEYASQFKVKAEKWDVLGKEISKFYCDKEGEYSESNPEVEGDLTTIGEVAATAYGWL